MPSPDPAPWKSYYNYSIPTEPIQSFHRSMRNLAERLELSMCMLRFFLCMPNRSCRHQNYVPRTASFWKSRRSLQSPIFTNAVPCSIRINWSVSSWISSPICILYCLPADIRYIRLCFMLLLFPFKYFDHTKWINYRSVFHSLTDLGRRSNFYYFIFKKRKETNIVRNSAAGTASQIPVIPQIPGKNARNKSSRAKERRKVITPERCPFP